MVEEFALLATTLPGARLTKIRRRLRTPPGVTLLSVDEFGGALAGLVLAEAEFETSEALAAFAGPDFAAHERDARASAGRDCFRTTGYAN